MKFNRNGAMLLCSDVPAARDFYVERLGLRVNADIGWFVGLQHPDKPITEFELSLCAADHKTVPEAIRTPTQGLLLAFEIADAKTAFDEQREAGGLLSELIDEPWGQRHFYVSAPDGVVLDFFQLIEPDPTWMKEHGFA